MAEVMRIKKIGFSGASVLEYSILILAFLMALMAMQPYIRNAIVGQYRKAGEGIGFLRQYDPKDTQVCVQDEGGVIYSRICFENNMSECSLQMLGGSDCFNGIKQNCARDCIGVQ